MKEQGESHAHRQNRPADCWGSTQNKDISHIESVVRVNMSIMDMEEDQGETEDGVVEEGDPVKPGDTLVVAQPFVFAIQSQFRNKVCENCLA